MKKLISNLLILVSISLFFVSCDKEDLTVYNSSATTTLSLSAADIILDKNNAGQDVLTLNWTKPDYGFNAGASYSIMFSANGKETTISNGTDLSKTFETVEFNKILQGLDFEGGVQGTVSVKIQATLSETTKFTSNAVDLAATSYEDKLDLSTTWGLVGSATPNGWDGPDVPFYKTSSATVFVAYATLTDGFIKFRENNEWANNYGSDSNTGGAISASGSDIPVTAGTYKITLDLVNLTYGIETYSWGLVGSATPNGWDGPDLALTYDSYSDSWKAIVALADGEVKVRQNNEWTVNYGDATLDGVLDTDADNNIAVTAGNYLVTVDFNTLEYSIEAIDVWGVVGSATPNGWDGPDTKFTLDYSKDDVWVLDNIVLVDGEIKFRLNDAWDVNYGDLTLDGILDQENDNNIAVTAGTYSIELDFSDMNAPTYTLTQK